MFFNQPFGGVVPGARGAVLAALLRTGTPLSGRQIHGLVGDDHSLWTVQQALTALTRLGVVETQMVGRAGQHTINEDHVSVRALRTLLDPIAALGDVVTDAIQVARDEVSGVILFGSIARGEATSESDIDLAVIASSGWDQCSELEDAVRTRLGNDCDVLVFTASEFARSAANGEPVVLDILRDGVALIGSMPQSPVGMR